MVRLLSFFLLVVSVSSFGQDSTIQYQPVHVIIKLAPLSLLLDPDATIQGGLEVRVSPRTSVQAEVGFGHKGLSVVKDEKQNFIDWSIWRVRSEWRHYTGRYRTSRKKNIHIQSTFPLGNYLAIEGFAKQINGTEKVIPGLIDPNISLDQESSINRFVVGSHIKWGRQIAIPGQSLSALSRVLLDFYLGVGARYGMTDALDTNDCDCGPVYDRFKPGNRLQPSLALGMKIGFGL